MLKNYINSLLIIANKIQENQLNEIINTINKAIKNKKKNLYLWKWWFCIIIGTRTM